jgi:hypothetical protein
MACQGSAGSLAGISPEDAMPVRCARKIPSDTAYALRPQCPNAAAVFTRGNMTGKLRPLCAQCLENAFDDVARRLPLEEGADEWVVQEAMEA